MSQTLENHLVSDIVKFCYEHGGIDYEVQGFTKSVEGFIKNNTFNLLFDKSGNIVSFFIYNIVDENVAQVEEAIIHKDHRGKGLCKYVALLELMKFPQLRKIRFCRQRKYKGRPPRETDLYKFIRR